MSSKRSMAFAERPLTGLDSSNLQRCEIELYLQKHPEEQPRNTREPQPTTDRDYTSGSR
ncbi:MAG: hypothetical protein KKF56_04025 [Nanoarchaeota archaeon]|nr:hypothetical protein [Nanoarchaeota archaeon]